MPSSGSASTRRLSSRRPRRRDDRVAGSARSTSITESHPWRRVYSNAQGDWLRVRAHGSHPWGHWFESSIAHHLTSIEAGNTGTRPRLSASSLLPRRSRAGATHAPARTGLRHRRCGCTRGCPGPPSALVLWPDGVGRARRPRPGCAASRSDRPSRAGSISTNHGRRVLAWAAGGHMALASLVCGCTFPVHRARRARPIRPVHERERAWPVRVSEPRGHQRDWVSGERSWSRSCQRPNSCGVARRRRRYRSRHRRHAGGGGTCHCGPEQRQPTTSASAQRGRRGSASFAGPRPPGPSRLAGVAMGPRRGAIVRQGSGAPSPCSVDRSVDDSLLRTARLSRRRFLAAAGLAGMSAAMAGVAPTTLAGSAQAAVHLVPRDPGRADRRACGGAAVGGQPGGDARQLPRRPRSAGQRRCAPQAPAALRIHRRGPDRSFAARSLPGGRPDGLQSGHPVQVRFGRAPQDGRSGPAAPHHESQPTCLAGRRDSRGGHRRVPPDT